MATAARSRHRWLNAVTVAAAVALGALAAPALPSGERLVAAGAAGVSLVLVERDTLQTRNYQPIVNHQAMVVNQSGQPLEVAIVSPIPDGRDVEGPFWPAFGLQSALGVPMQCPWPLDVANYRLLEETPSHRKAEGGRPAAFVWDGVTVAPREAVIAQYDNYYGPKDVFYTPSGIGIADLDIGVGYSLTDLGAGRFNAALRYRLTNRTGHEIRELSLSVFVPDTMIEASGPVQIVEVTGATVPPSVRQGKMTGADGVGRVASGCDFFLGPRTLGAGETVEVVVRLNWRVVGAGEIHPTVAVQGRGEGARLWPETQLQPGASGGQGQAQALRPSRAFYYRMWNIVLPDRSYVTVGPGSRARVQRR